EGCPACQLALAALAAPPGTPPLPPPKSWRHDPGPEFLDRLKRVALFPGETAIPGLEAATPGTPPCLGDGWPAVPGYTLEGELGRGGMAVVYRARQLRLDRPVALKMILAGGSASARERADFRREAEALARLAHPGIVQIHEIGEHAGQLYL